MDSLGYSFQVEVGIVDEDSIFRESIARNHHLGEAEQVALACRTVAEAKAKAIAKQSTNRARAVLAADTIVYDGDNVLGKPADEAHALEMLRSLSGHTHQVMTATAVIVGSYLESFVSIANVTFYPWDSHQKEAAQRSILSGSAMDKAGAYGIQEDAAVLVESIEGDYDTIVGLPLAAVYRLLAKHGIYPESSPNA